MGHSKFKTDDTRWSVKMNTWHANFSSGCHTFIIDEIHVFMIELKKKTWKFNYTYFYLKIHNVEKK